MATRLVLENRLHVLGRHEDLDPERLERKVAIVLDVLFATSTIAAALANGAKSVVPAIDEAAARQAAAPYPAGGAVLAGELNAITLPGFAPPTPLALVRHGVSGRTVVYSTTNGTVALDAVRSAHQVYAAALVNGPAVVRHVLAAHPDRTVLLVCAGSMGNFNLEDWYGAGYLVDLFVSELGEGLDLSDAALAARAQYRSGRPDEVLMRSRVGRMFSARGLAVEIDYAARPGLLDVVPRLIDGRLVAVRSA